LFKILVSGVREGRRGAIEGRREGGGGAEAVVPELEEKVAK